MSENWITIAAAAFVSSVVAAITGTGGSVILLPVLVGVFGVREAVPIFSVVALVSNLSRVGMNWHSIDRRAVAWYSLGSIPFTLLGAWLFTRIPDSGLLRILGAFLIASVIARRLHPALRSTFPPQWFSLIGGVFAVFSSITGSAGPFVAPFYLSYGLTKAAYIGTEALGATIAHIIRLGAYQSFGAITPKIWLYGLMLGPLMISGTFLGKRLLSRIPTKLFILIIELAVLGFGIRFIVK
jgi:uncharacterized membrane protein YfcA